jgi:hypothetical protein
MSAMPLNEMELLYLLGNSSGLFLKGEKKICAEFANILRYESLAGNLDGVWLHVPNEWPGRNHYHYENVQRDMGKIPGALDYVFLSTKAGILWLEAKVPGGTLSEKQKLFQRWCDMHGIAHAVFKSAYQGCAILRERGFLRG